MSVPAHPEHNMHDDDSSSTTKASYRTISRTSSEDEGLHETSPLLSSTIKRGSVIHADKSWGRWRSPRAVSVLTMVLLLMMSFGDQLNEWPTTRELEAVICYRYFEVADPTVIQIPRNAIGPGAIGGVQESLCKADAVQDELAMLRGYKQSLEAIPGLLLSIPFAYLADRYGRWWLLFLNLLSTSLKVGWVQLVLCFWQAFDIRWIYFSAVLNGIGGGDAVTSTLFLTILTDITRDSQRAAVFLRAGAVNISASLFMPPLAALLMEINPWIPSMMGLLLMCLGVLGFLFFPETLNYRSDPPLLSSDMNHVPPDAPLATSPVSRGVVDTWITELRPAVAFLTNDWRVPALMVPFMSHLLTANCGQLLVQYISKRYGLTLAQGTFLITVRNGVSCVLLSLILPYLSTTVMRLYGICSQRKDVYLARISQLLFAFGWLWVAISPNEFMVAIGLAIGTLGSGSFLLVRSFLASLCSPHEMARLYSVVSMIDTLGVMLGSPLLGHLFKSGLALGGGWVGLPFYFISMISAIYALVFFLVPPRKGDALRTDIEEVE